MAQNQQAGSRGGHRRGSPGLVSRWVQHRMNARMNRNTDREYPVIRLTLR